MNRFHVVVTTLVAAASLGFTLRTLGQHDVPDTAAPAADPTPYTQDSEQVPRSDPAEIPPSF
jgi:hypothetical protein